MLRRIARKGAAVDTVTDRVPEWRLQAEAVAGLEELLEAHPGAFAYAASLEGVIGNLNPYQAQLAAATGVKRGEADLRVYLPSARLELIELKGEGGKLSKVQKERHALLAALGWTVTVIERHTPAEMRAAVVAHVRDLAGLAP
jgi:hypothetical protein